MPYRMRARPSGQSGAVALSHPNARRCSVIRTSPGIGDRSVTRHATSLSRLAATPVVDRPSSIRPLLPDTSELLTRIQALSVRPPRCLDSESPGGAPASHISLRVMPTGAESRISIIIPSRCDAPALRRTVDALTAVAGIERAEVIVAAWGDQAGTDRAVAGRARLLWPGGSTRAA